MRLLILVLGLTVTLSACQTVRVASEKFDFQTPYYYSHTYMYRGEYKEKRSGSAEVFLPDGIETTKKHPAIVIAHGASGIGKQQFWWRDRLLDRGFIVAMIDSYTNRGLTNTIMEPFAVTHEEMIGDAFMTLERLAKNPLVDTKRIGIMGGSRGGITALYSGMKGVREKFIDSNVEYAFHISKYPYCGFYPLGMKTTGKPTLLMAGAKDDLTWAVHCQRFVEKAKAAGNTNITYVEYPNVGHSIDNPSIINLPTPTFTMRFWSPNDCYFEQREDGIFYEGISGRSTLTKEDRAAIREYGGICEKQKNPTVTFIRPPSEVVDDARRKILDFVKPFEGAK